MKPRGDYTPVKLFYDGGKVEVGDFMRSNGGSVYRIDDVRQSPSIERRRYLNCTRWPADEIPAGATVHPIHWYARKKKAARRLAEFAR